MIPRQWGGQGLLGLVVKYDSIEEAENQGLRVLEILPTSPAAAAGLIPYKDFIIGSRDVIIRDSDDLGQLLSASLGQTLSLTVYNTDRECTREVLILPNREWGGEGLLGCGIGTGVLHRIPMSRKSFVPQLIDGDQSELPQSNGVPPHAQQSEGEPVPSFSTSIVPVSPLEPFASPAVDIIAGEEKGESESNAILVNAAHQGATSDISKLFD